MPIHEIADEGAGEVAGEGEGFSSRVLSRNNTKQHEIPDLHD